MIPLNVNATGKSNNWLTRVTLRNLNIVFTHLVSPPDSEYKYASVGYIILGTSTAVFKLIIQQDNNVKASQFGSYGGSPRKTVHRCLYYCTAQMWSPTRSVMYYSFVKYDGFRIRCPLPPMPPISFLYIQSDSCTRTTHRILWHARCI